MLHQGGPDRRLEAAFLEKYGEAEGDKLAEQYLDPVRREAAIKAAQTRAAAGGGGDSSRGGRPTVTGGGGMNQHPVERLIQDIAEGGRAAVEDELVQISRHIGELGFSPSDLSKHFEKHVKRQKEWPEGTNDIEYIDSLRQVVLNSRSGIALSQWWRQTRWHVTIMGRSGQFKGPGGSDWIAVEYRVGDESWATAFQPKAGMGHVDSHYRRRNVRWLRRPK